MKLSLVSTDTLTSVLGDYSYYVDNDFSPDEKESDLANIAALEAEIAVNPINQLAEAFYLEYFNDYLTTEKMTDRYGISDELAAYLMLHGQKLNRARPAKVV